AAAGGGEFIFISAVAFLLGGRAVAPVVTVSNLLGVPSRVLLFREHIDWSIVRWFLLGAVPGGFVGSWLFARTTAAWLQWWSPPSCSARLCSTASASESARSACASGGSFRLASRSEEHTSELQ